MVRFGSRGLGALLAAASSMTAGPLIATDGEQAEPVRVLAAAPSLDCPSIQGTFVALLAADRGVLLLAGQAFPGARGPVIARDGTLVFQLPEGGRWSVDELRVSTPAQRVWYARYPFRGTLASGCVAFDRTRFSSEGDLASYVYWLVDSVYLKLPEAERRRHPAFVVSNRHVTLRVERPGFGPLPLAGKEAAAMAFRFPGDVRTALLVPYVLDAASGRLALEVARAADLTPPAVPREFLGFVMATVGESVALPDLDVVVTIDGIAPTAP